MDLKKYIKSSNEIKWKRNNKKKYNEYMKTYMLSYRKEKKKTCLKRKLYSKIPTFLNIEIKKTIIELN